MTAEVRGDVSLGSVLNGVLRSSREELLIGLTHGSLRPGWLAVVAAARMATDDEVQRDRSGLHWTGDLTAAMYAAARAAGAGVLLIHAHGGGGQPPEPSRPDQNTAREILGHFGQCCRITCMGIS